MSKSFFWFEKVSDADPVARAAGAISDNTWRYMIGTGDSTPVALVAGPDDHTAAYRARFLCEALNKEHQLMTSAARNDDDG